MITVDCDVLEADGGTRTASINGSWIALNDTFNKLVENGELVQNPLMNQIAALSVGIVDGKYIVDLDYEHDSQAEVDLNLVLNDKYEILEIQGTAEKNHLQKKIWINYLKKLKKQLMRYLKFKKINGNYISY